MDRGNWPCELKQVYSGVRSVKHEPSGKQNMEETDFSGVAGFGLLFEIVKYHVLDLNICKIPRIIEYE